jgi:hypothetical protein
MLCEKFDASGRAVYAPSPLLAQGGGGASCADARLFAEAMWARGLWHEAQPLPTATSLAANGVEDVDADDGNSLLPHGGFAPMAPSAALPVCEQPFSQHDAYTLLVTLRFTSMDEQSDYALTEASFHVNSAMLRHMQVLKAQSVELK